MPLKAEGRRQTVEFFPGFCFLPLAFDIMSAQFTRIFVGEFAPNLLIGAAAKRQLAPTRIVAPIDGI